MGFISFLHRAKAQLAARKWGIINIALGAFDILLIALAFQSSFYLNYYDIGGFFFTEKRFLTLFLWILPFWLIILYFFKIAEVPRTKRYRFIFLEFVQAAIVTFLVLTIIYFVFNLHEISRLFLIGITFFGFLYLFVARILTYKVFKSYRAKGHNFIRVVIIGDENALPFIDTLVSKIEWGYKIVAIFTDNEIITGKYEKSILLFQEKYLGVLNDLMEVDIIDEVFYIKKKIVPARIREIIGSCEELGVTFNLRFYEENNKLTTAIKTTIGEEKFLTFINVPHDALAITIKKVMDINISLLLLVVISPVLLLITVLIKATSPGPVLFKQKRIGLRGRQFNMYKFRTMVVNAEAMKKDLEFENEADGPVFKIKNDPRITKVGKILRRTGLDELPQLINVLKGEMSLIGPRPPLYEETIAYKRWQMRRLSVKPGLSCFWQIKPDRNSIKFEKWMEMDLAYIDNWSLRLDLMILLKTIKTVFQRAGL